MHLLQKSTRPRMPGGQKLQPVLYSIYRSRIAINIARSLIPLEYKISNVIEYHFFIELISLSHENIEFYRIQQVFLSNTFFSIA